MNNNPLAKKYIKPAFIVIVVLQFMVLGSMIGKRTRLLKTGIPVMLKCEPIDPRSLFSGDYVKLNYEISRISKNQLDRKYDKEQDALKINGTVYVALEKEEAGRFWKARAVSADLYSLKKKYPVIIEGKLRGYYYTHSKSYNIRYGVEDYFVPQFKGSEIEKNLKNVSVEVAISDSGESGIRRLFINDQEVTFY